MGTAYGALVRRARTKGSEIQFFAASLADIEKSLRRKYPRTKEELFEKLPSQYHGYIDVFDPTNPNTLLPHRTGIDHQI